METVKIKKEQITNKGQNITGKAILNFVIENFTPEVTITVFRQENPTFIKIPAQLNTYSGHKLIGNFNIETKIFEAVTLQEEDISEIMTHKEQIQWKNPY